MADETTPKTPEQMALEQLEAQLAAEEAAARAAAEKRAAAAAAPEAQMLELKAKLDAAKRQREAAERGAEDDAAIRRLRAEHGDRMRVVYTAAGSLVCIWTEHHEAKWDAVEARAKNLTKAALEASPPDPIRAETDALKAFRDGYLDHVVAYPEKAKAKAILKQYPDAWQDVFVARAELARGPREAAGKGGGL